MPAFLRAFSSLSSHAPETTGFAQIVAQSIKPDDPLNSALKTIEREAIRCKNLVRDLLTFSRSSKSDDLVDMDLNSVIDSALSLIEDRTKVSNTHLVREFDPQLPKAPMNSNQIQQIVINLANNAIDAMPNGGTITVRTHLSKKKEGTVFSVMLPLSQESKG